MSNVRRLPLPSHRPETLPEMLRSLPAKGLRWIISDIDPDTSDEYDRGILQRVNDEFERRQFKGVVDEVAVMRARRRVPAPMG